MITIWLYGAACIALFFGFAVGIVGRDEPEVWIRFLIVAALWPLALLGCIGAGLAALLCRAISGSAPTPTGERCTVVARARTTSAQTESLSHVDATPDSDYPARILRAHLAANDSGAEWLGQSADGSAEKLAAMMNEWSAERARLLREALHKLGAPVDQAVADGTRFTAARNDHADLGPGTTHHDTPAACGCHERLAARRRMDAERVDHVLAAYLEERSKHTLWSEIQGARESLARLASTSGATPASGVESGDDQQT